MTAPDPPHPPTGPPDALPADLPADLPHELPERPMLRPGLRVVRRDDGHLQIGLGPDRLVVRDSPGTRKTLDALANGLPALPAVDEARPVCLLLHRAGLLMDAVTFWRSPVCGPATAAAYAADPAGAATALARRGRQGVALDLPAAWSAPVLALLEQTGLRRCPPGPPSGSPPAVVLVGRQGEPVRSDLDTLVRTGAPHLLLTGADGRLTVGPFVEPGRTACLRCVDAHAAERDPRHALVVEQYASPSTARLLPEPVDPALLALALGWAVRDLVTWVDGGTPSLWSTSVVLTGDLELPRRRWTRHPHCGCSWGDALAVG